MPPYYRTTGSPTTIPYGDSKPDMVDVFSHSQSLSHEKLRSVSYDEDERVTVAKKTVSFAPQAELYLIPHYQELSDEEFEATYMSSEDFHRIDKDNVQTVQEMLQGSYPSTEELYFRGLENALPQTAKDRKQRINFVVYHVLQEQFQNRWLQEEWIESLQFHYTSKSAEFAYKMGVWDYEAMREDLLNDAMFMSPFAGQHSS